MSLSGPGELGRVACASVKRPQNTMFLISHFYFLESFIFSDFFHAVRLSAVTFCSCQLSSFLPDSSLLLGLSCRFSNQTPKQVSILHQVRPLHNLSRVRVLWRGAFVMEMSFFVFCNESEMLFKRPQRWDQRESDIAGAFAVKSCILFSLLVWELMRHSDYQRFYSK